MLDLIPAGTSAYGPWWATSEGSWLYRRIEERIGKPLVLWVGRVYGPRYDAVDVANSAVEVMSSEHLIASLTGADDQWAYLSAVLKRELIQQVGGFFRDEADIEPTGPQFENPNELTPVVEAVRLTVDCLHPYTPEEILPHLAELVFYFAERGHANLSHLHSNAARDPELLQLGLQPKQILAVANVVLGSRPNHAAGSILGGFLHDRDWRPQESTTHVRSLTKYAMRMAAQTAPAHLALAS